MFETYRPIPFQEMPNLRELFQRASFLFIEIEYVFENSREQLAFQLLARLCKLELNVSYLFWPNHERIFHHSSVFIDVFIHL